MPANMTGAKYFMRKKETQTKPFFFRISRVLNILCARMFFLQLPVFFTRVGFTRVFFLPLFLFTRVFFLPVFASRSYPFSAFARKLCVRYFTSVTVSRYESTLFFFGIRFFTYRGTVYITIITVYNF